MALHTKNVSKGILLLAIIVPSGNCLPSRDSELYTDEILVDNSLNLPRQLMIFINIFSAVLGHWCWNKFVVRHWGSPIWIIEYVLKGWYIIQRTFSLRYRQNLEEDIRPRLLNVRSLTSYMMWFNDFQKCGWFDFYLLLIFVKESIQLFM